MPIDFSDVRQTWANPYQPDTPQVRVMALSDAWVDLQGTIHEETKAIQAKLDAHLDTMKYSGDYSYEYLAKQKSLLDIISAELLLIQRLERTIAAYHEHGGEHGKEDQLT